MLFEGIHFGDFWTKASCVWIRSDRSENWGPLLNADYTDAEKCAYMLLLKVLFLLVLLSPNKYVENPLGQIKFAANRLKVIEVKEL